MKRADTRYKGVYDAGYEQACEDVSDAVLRWLKDGGEIIPSGPDGFGYRFAARKGGTIAAVNNLLGLAGFRPVRDR